jgi:hypothetical protein
MDRAMLLNNLAMAESHISEGEQHLMRQQKIIARLQRNRPGSEALKQAISLLETMERAQRSHLADRERLKRMLHKG